MGDTMEFEIYEFLGHSYPIIIYFAPSEHEWRGLLIKEGIITVDNPDEPYPDNGAGARVSGFDLKHAPGYMCVITISDQAETYSAAMVMGMLVHELVHVKQHIEERAYGNNFGAGDTRLDMETEAYLMQAMLMWLNQSYSAAGRKFKED